MKQCTLKHGFLNDHLRIFRYLSLFIILSMLSACGGDSGFVKNTKTDDKDPDSQPVVNGNWYRPAIMVSWQWQLQGAVNTSYDAEIYDIDLFDASSTLMSQLQAQGKKVICYFSAGSYEQWRPDENLFNVSELGRPLADWAGERWLDIRSGNVRSIMRKRLDLARQKGCDGVEPDNMDGYLNLTGFSLTGEDQLAYNRFIGNEAHRRELSVALKNDLGQVSKLVDFYDFAVNEQCFEFSECDLLAPFIINGKPVLNAEYDTPFVMDAMLRNDLCRESSRLHFSSLVLPVELDDSFRFSCL